MSAIVERTVQVDAPVSAVFAYVDDFDTTKEWMYGLQSIEPVTEQLRGVGASYDGVMKLGVRLTSRILCTGYGENRLIELTSTKGIQNTQRWTFTDLGDDRTQVDAWVSYMLPGGPTGKAIEKAVKPFIGIGVEHTAARLVANIEARQR